MRITTARLFLVDYSRIFADFEYLRPENLVLLNPGFGKLSESDRQNAARDLVDHWLLENAALVSTTQTRQTEVNTLIKAEGKIRQVYRPPRYGRAFITRVAEVLTQFEAIAGFVKTPASGELDIKGTGVGLGKKPVRGKHKSGNLLLISAVEDYLFERLIERILQHAESEFRTLPTYAIIDTGFDGFVSKLVAPAGLLVRRAHVRDIRSDLPELDSKAQYQIFGLELTLRRYGLTSCKGNLLEIRDESGKLAAYECNDRSEWDDTFLRSISEHHELTLPFTADRVNIQTDVFAQEGKFSPQIVDFEHYGVSQRFERPVLSLVRNRPLAWGGMITPADSCFVQPEPELCPPQLFWNIPPDPFDQQRMAHSGTIEHFAKATIDAFRRGDIDKNEVFSRTESIIQHATQNWELKQAGDPHRSTSGFDRQQRSIP